MVKSFKKAIACLLAVLMVACSLPFTALASPGEDKADVQLLFNPVYTGGYFRYEEVLAADSLFDYTMLQEAPLTYDYKLDGATVSGKLTLEAEKTVPLCDDLGVDPLEEDTELGVGDYFSVTIAMKDCPSIYASQVYLEYSENIEPAGAYSVTKSRKAYQGLAGISDGKSITVGGEASAVASYYAGLNDGVLGDMGGIDAENRIISSIMTVQNGAKSIPTTTVDPGDAVYTDPATGELGYTFDGMALCNTFIFKIVDEGDISFSMYDTDNTKVDNYGAAFLLAADEGKGLKPNQYTTYAKNTYGTDGTVENAGSCKMTFFGKNVNVQSTDPEPCKHANTTTVNAKAATCEEDGYTGDTKCTDCEEIIANGETIKKLGHSYTSSVTTPATCTTPGVTTYTCVRGDSTYEDATTPAAKGHTPVSANNAVTATCKADGKESDTICDVCRTTLTTGKTISKTTVEHTPGTAVEENRVEPTYTTKGSYDEVVYCTVCETELSRENKEIPAATCSHVNTTTVGAKEATCTEDGYTGDTKCTDCEEIIANGETIGKLGHDMQVVPGTAVTATCKADGKEADMACSRGDKTETGKTISKETVAHTPVSANNAVAPTVAKDGKEADTICSVCKETLKTGKTIKATGVNVKVENTYDSFGEAAYGTKNYAFGSDVTLTAKAYEDCEFVGWQVANKIVSTKATYQFEATVDVTVTPVFRQVDADKISVIFYDKYSNVIASYMDVTVADFQAAMATKIPTAPVYAGYTFAGYSYTDPEILALDESATIVAYYNEDKAQGFTVETTAEATITIDAKRGTKESDQKYVDVMFDTQATVTAEGAKAWKVDDAIVGYGETYTFFVGSDIKLEPVLEAVEAKPAVAMVKAYKIAADSHKIMFLASMNIPDGFKLVDHGFVYGKNMITSDLVLEKVGNKGTAAVAGDVKKTSAGTNTVEQFGISYGITKQTGKACAVAYLTFVKDGDITTIYSDAVAYDYDNGNTIPVEEGADD